MKSHSAANTVFAIFTTFLLTSTLASQPAQAQTFTTLHNFVGGTDGGNPDAQPVRDKRGNFFGTAYLWGPYDDGTVWVLRSSGAFSVLHSFNGSDGRNPYAALTQGKNGNMFGTTTYGGSADWGTAFRIDANRTFKKLYDFGSAPGDPEQINEGITLDPTGNLYGTSVQGPAPDYGTVWKLTTDWSETVLYNFSGGSDGEYPTSGLYRDPEGDLFGTTGNGGSLGCGTLFKIKRDGSFELVHTFNGLDGCGPGGTLLEYKDYLYGTAIKGGNPNCDYGAGCGTVWQYSLKSGRLTVLHKFSDSDGIYPAGGVTCQPGKKTVCTGNLFGTASEGGNIGYSYGTVWEINSKGRFSVLHTFSWPDGAYPYARPFVDNKGNVYGTASEGGLYRAGTLWKITLAKSSL
jgi:uncharacterized repeat protein (TIGR03803 family)